MCQSNREGQAVSAVAKHLLFTLDLHQSQHFLAKACLALSSQFKSLRLANSDECRHFPCRGKLSLWIISLRDVATFWSSFMCRRIFFLGTFSWAKPHVLAFMISYLTYTYVTYTVILVKHLQDEDGFSSQDLISQFYYWNPPICLFLIEQSSE